MLNQAWHAAAALVLSLAWPGWPASAAADEQPAAVPTFECVGLSWKAPGGGADKTCVARYRAAGADAWKDAMPLWFDARNGEYRGSIVSLFDHR